MIAQVVRLVPSAHAMPEITMFLRYVLGTAFPSVVVDLSMQGSQEVGLLVLLFTGEGSEARNCYRVPGSVQSEPVHLTTLPLFLWGNPWSPISSTLPLCGCVYIWALWVGELIKAGCSASQNTWNLAALGSFFSAVEVRVWFQDSPPSCLYHIPQCSARAFSRFSQVLTPQYA